MTVEEVVAVVVMLAAMTMVMVVSAVQNASVALR